MTTEQKTILITGGTGLIGRKLASLFLADKTNTYDVIALSRNPKAYSNLPSGLKVEQWDAKTADGWGHLAEGAYAIINLAGASLADGRWTKERKDLILNSRLNAGRAVVQAVQQAAKKPRMVFQASAVGYYGSRQSTPLTETAAAGDDFPAQVSVQWEPSTADVIKHDVRQVIGRIGIVYSMDGGALPQLILPFKMFAGGPVGNGEQWVSWIHIDDTARAIKFLVESNAAEGIYNLTAPTPITNEVLSYKIGTVMGRPARLKAPSFALKIGLGEMATLALDGQRVVPERLLKSGFQFHYTDAETALRDLML